MSLKTLTKPWAATSYGFLERSAKREVRRKLLKAIAVPRLPDAVSPAAKCRWRAAGAPADCR